MTGINLRHTSENRALNGMDTNKDKNISYGELKAALKEKGITGPIDKKNGCPVRF